jgi:hypothetical protein
VETAALWKSIKVAYGNIFLMISTTLENADAKNSVDLFTVTTSPDGEYLNNGIWDKNQNPETSLTQNSGHYLRQR